MTQPSLPHGLLARWRDLPGLARLAQQRISPPRTGPIDAAAARVLWLMTLPVYRASGTLLAHRGAMMVISCARVSPARRLAQLGALAATGVAFAAVLIATTTATELVASLLRVPSGLGQLTVTLIVVILVGRAIVRTLRDAPPGLDEHRARCSLSAAWQITAFAAETHAPTAAGRLARRLLDHADAHGVYLVATPRTERLRRVYQARGGFIALDGRGRVLVRPPRERSSLHR
ncbi:hypothetical protein [Streptomyces sp. NPDC055140]